MHMPNRIWFGKAICGIEKYLKIQDLFSKDRSFKEMRKNIRKEIRFH